jgi:hypothetical protein
VATEFVAVFDVSKNGSFLYEVITQSGDRSSLFKFTTSRKRI